MPITLENLDEVFCYHSWSDEQRQSGNAIRSAAKEVSRSVLQYNSPEEVLERIDAFEKSICDSAIPTPEKVTDLYIYALNRREKALAQVKVMRGMYRTSYHVPELLNFVNEIVMMANSAITFEAAELLRESVQDSPRT